MSFKKQLIHIAIALFLFGQSAKSVPAYPGLAEVSQPDGTKIKIRLKGNEFKSWYEDDKGNKIYKNKHGIWLYLLKRRNGELAPLSVMVGSTPPDSVSDSLEKSAENTLEQSSFNQLPTRHSPDFTPTPVSGTKRNLVILVDFPNLPHQQSSTVQSITKIFNEKGYSDDGGTGSVRDYFKEVSYGRFDFVSYVVEWVRVSQNFEYYGKNDPNTGFDSKPREMVAEALHILNNRGFDFTIVDYDKDGKIDGLTVLHSGGAEEYPGNDSNFIWSHKWQLLSPVSYDGVSIHEYHTVPECMGITSDPSTHSVTRIGVVCHEAMHLLGLPDLYDKDYSSAGVGNFCLMGTGLWNGAPGQFATQPAHLSAWCKAKLGWINPQEITEDKLFTLPQVETNPAVAKLSVPGNNNEYFLIENRQPVGFDQSLPGEEQGILIWHVDESKNSNTDETHFMVDLEEPGEVQGLELNLSRGEQDDYFREDTSRSFSLSSSPSNETYDNEFLTIKIDNISESKEIMTFTTASYNGFFIEGVGAIDELSSASYKGVASYSDQSQEDISAKLKWSTDSNEASVNSNGKVITQQVYTDSNFNLYATFGSTVSKNIKINDISLRLEKIGQMLDPAPLIQEEFYEYISPKVQDMDLNMISEYQQEFKRNLDYVENKTDWYQTIINEVNAGRNIVINHVSSGWNMISSPFQDWYPDLINSEFESRYIYSFDREKTVYMALYSSFKLELCKAYWVYFSDTEIPEEERLEYYMSGNLQLDHNLDLSVGWNFIGGSKEDETVTDNVDVFIWDAFIEDYHQIQENEPLKLGKGYWIFKFNVMQ